MNGSDPLVVATVELAGVLRLWVDRWYAERATSHRPPHSVREGEVVGLDDSYSQPMPEFGPAKYVREYAGISEKQFYTILNCRTKWTTLQIADKVLCAIGEVTRLYDGTVRIVPNPRWDPERWATYTAERSCE